MQIVPETIDNTNPNTVEGQTDPFNHPIPGESLTREAGEGNFERPPEQTDPQAVIEQQRILNQQASLSSLQTGARKTQTGEVAGLEEV